MAKRVFKPILTDLELLTQTEREQYVLDVCEFLKVPPELGLVRLTYMDSGFGKRNLVLYCEKGATDIIRSNRGIDIDSLDEVNGPGYVGWKARGHDKEGRHEIAVGTVSIDGLKGVEAANKVMVAQTKSLRRMTLQFAGGGFLDATEIGEATVDVVNSSTLGKTTAQPAVKPNVEAGKDTTPESQENVPVAAPIAETATVEVTPKRRGRPRRTVSLDTSISEAQPAAAQAPPHGAVEAEPVSEQKRPEPTAVAPFPAVTVSSVIPMAVEPPRPAEEEKPSDGGTVTTAEQRKAYREQLSKYVNEILPPGGFLQSTKLGSRNDKMKLFVQKVFPKSNIKYLSVEQWDHFLMFMQSKIQELTLPDLVKLIHKTIGEEEVSVE